MATSTIITLLTPGAQIQASPESGLLAKKDRL